MEKEERLSDTQMGFRSRRGTIDAIYMFKTVIEKEIETGGGRVNVSFADMKGRFDNLSRERLWKMLKKLKIEKNLRWRIVRQ